MKGDGRTWRREDESIDFLAESRSSTDAGPRWAIDETVGRTGVWVAATLAGKSHEDNVGVSGYDIYLYARCSCRGASHANYLLTYRHRMDSVVEQLTGARVNSLDST